MDKPKPPCRKGCEYRSANCHNETCPYGWVEYEKQNIEFSNKMVEMRERYYATRPITEANKQFNHQVLMQKKRTGRT